MLDSDKRRLDRRLWVSILLGPIAAGVNTIVGYTVAHWINDVGRGRSGFLVSGIDFALCIIAALLAAHTYRFLHGADETRPEVGRQLFMAKMGLILAAVSAIIVIAGTSALFIIGPND
jgi:hypothetical protein